MTRAERAIVIAALFFVVLYIPYFFVQAYRGTVGGLQVSPLVIFPLHFLGMALNFTALVVTIRDLYCSFVLFTVHLGNCYFGGVHQGMNNRLSSQHRMVPVWNMAISSAAMRRLIKLKIFIAAPQCGHFNGSTS